MKIAANILSKQDRDGMLRRSLERIIQLYTDKSHFVYELLQNAEDSGAKSIKFIQYADRLEVIHDGHPFTLENLQGLCDIGKSDKVNNLNQIGEFGVGFKSVFGICETVQLHSRPSVQYQSPEYQAFSVEIQDFTKPVDIDPVEVPEGYTTLFVFPYAVGFPFSGFKSTKELNRVLSARLKNLGVTTLLFMHDLSIIEYEIHLTNEILSGSYLLEKRRINDHCTLVSSMEEESNLDNPQKEPLLSYLKFSKPLKGAASRRTVDIAFPVTIEKDGSYTFHKAKSPFISVYFPTETESKLSFIVQGPYRTTPNRSSVPAEEDENISLANSTAELLCQVIRELRDQKKLNLSFINILPLDEDEFYSYSLFESVYEAVRDLFMTERVIPCITGEYVRAEQAIIARGQELPELFSNDLITNLIRENKSEHFYWLPTSLTETGPNKSIYNFFYQVLDIPVYRPEDLKRFFNTNKSFLPKQDDSWLIRLYRLYEKIPNVFSQSNARNILDACIVKTSNGDFLAPYRTNATAALSNYAHGTSQRVYLPNVFLPTKQNTTEIDVPFVDRTVYNGCPNFFSQVLHLQVPNEYEYFLKRIKQRYSSKIASITPEEHIEDFKTVLRYLSSSDYGADMRDSLKSSFKLRCVINNNHTDIAPFTKTILTPRTNTGLDIQGYYYAIKKDVVFVDLDFYEEHGVTFEQLKQLGVSSNLLIGDQRTSGTYSTGRPGGQPEWHTYDDFRWYLSIDMVAEALMYISSHPTEPNSMLKSQVIFRLLQDNTKKLIGTVHIGGSIPNKYNEPAEIIKILTKNGNQYYYGLSKWDGRWLYTAQNRLVSQRDISKHDLNPYLYGKTLLDSPLYEYLGFKKNEVDQMEAKVKEYDELPPEKKDTYFEIALLQRYNISIEQLEQTISGIKTDTESSEEEPFVFPSGYIKNWDALKKHAAQILCYASPVKYEYVVRHIRVSRPQDDIRAYLLNMYRVNTTGTYACQLCHMPKHNVEMCQLEENPDVELDPLNVCLCPNCANNFRVHRKNIISQERLIKSIVELQDQQISSSDPVEIEVGGGALWFTQTHIAEIRELLRLKAATKDYQGAASIQTGSEDDKALTSDKRTIPAPITKQPVLAEPETNATGSQDPQIVYTDYYQLKEKTRVCPFDGTNMLVKPKSVDCFDGKKRKLNFVYCGKCNRNFIFNLGQAIDLALYAVRKHDVPTNPQTNKPYTVATSVQRTQQVPIASKSQALATKAAKSVLEASSGPQYKLGYTAKLSVGDHVYSSEHGRGTVIKTRLTQSMNVVSVQFKNVTKEYQESIALSAGTIKKL